MLASVGCAATPLPPLGPAPADAWPRKPTLFMRIGGWGPLPQLDAAVVYELCLDDDRRALLAVRALTGQPPVDARMEAALRKWQWVAGSSEPGFGGTSCWHERFAPEMDDDGRKVMRASVSDFGKVVELIDDYEMIRVSRATDDDTSLLTAIRIDDRGPTRIVVLSPLLEVDDSGADSTQKLKARFKANPILPERFKRHHRDSRHFDVVRMCVHPAGDVTVRSFLPVLGAEQAVLAAAARWRFFPRSDEVCSYAMFRLSVPYW